MTPIPPQFNLTLKEKLLAVLLAYLAKIRPRGENGRFKKKEIVK